MITMSVQFASIVEKATCLNASSEGVQPKLSILRGINTKDNKTIIRTIIDSFVFICFSNFPQESNVCEFYFFIFVH